MYNMKYLSLPVFFVSLIIGLFFIYLYGPEQKTIYIYPSPGNIEEILFKDKADQCFYLDATEVKCPTSKTDIIQIPVQI